MKFRAIVVPFYCRKTIGWYFCQICSQFAYFSHCFAANSGVRKLSFAETGA